jgi:hypothetical protein
MLAYPEVEVVMVAVCRSSGVLRVLTLRAKLFNWEKWSAIRKLVRKSSEGSELLPVRQCSSEDRNSGRLNKALMRGNWDTAGNFDGQQ